MEQITPMVFIIIIVIYFSLLIIISHFTSKKSDSQTFFLANKSSPWILVAVGMIGASLSGVTFISIPGVVGADGANTQFSYMQMVMGYLVGYVIIATVLMPIYYRLNLTSIYGYFGERFGMNSYKTAAAYFILSRVVGASFRLYLVAMVLQIFIMDTLGVHFIWTVFITIALIWVYTFRGGIKTIVITDTLQTASMLTAVILTIWYIGKALDLNGIRDITSAIYKSEYSKWWFFDRGWNDPNNFFKQFISGALIALVMTGMDQDMMQKNLTCRNLVSAQKNMLTFSIILFFANILFLALGALLYIFAAQNGIPIPGATDQLYPTIALYHLPPVVGILFILGLIAAAYSSADSALTSLTTAFCIDFLGFERTGRSEAIKKTTRLKVHVGFSLLILVIIVLFKYLIDSAVINGLFKAAGYTYGPILGLFTYGILTKRKIKDKWVVPICLLAPVITYIIDTTSVKWLGGFQFGFTILALNGILTILGLIAISKKSHSDG